MGQLRKTRTDTDYYVYVYFDPRNFEMLYIGKGHGSRKNAHKPNKLGSAKERQIHEIRREGLQPLIKVVAAKLTEDQAYLVEKALIWKSGKSLTNINQGRYAENFRPPDSLHLSLPGFDSDRGIFFVNVGDRPHRLWEDAQKFGFLAAGYDTKYSDQLKRLAVDDIIAAYISGSGYVGIGRVNAEAAPASEFRYKRRPLSRRVLTGPDLLHDLKNANKCEYLVGIEWIKTLSRTDARFRRNGGLFTTRRIVANLSNQIQTLRFLENEFDVKFQKLLAI